MTKTSKNKILDIPSIQKNVKDKHNKFIKEFGPAIEKVVADHKLFADIVIAKLNRIAVIFKEEKVIDDTKIVDFGPYKKITFSKIGYDTYVNIVTNGLEIILQGITYTEADLRMRNVKFSEVNSNNFDWNDFSNKTLDYIHAAIYGRKEAGEARLAFLFQNNFKDDLNNSKDK
jgi:hypothetical protein